ncbi:hypothetical protein K431DRAFT_122962 [Polychaeton citri CBS 116435]|uniref:Uncharacterized protein n=1 Tax=Polychaeton citri CBS 116435 TaxID=1314669 RepID=A0A9P4Q1P9_9PEZI|nr:hypothetical protein K431DRAFT_122962 [Polychaeton citri CBS 116435]
MTGLLFVTAPSADFKLINRLLLIIRDWEYEAGDAFKFVTTRNAYELEAREDNPHDTEPTHPPIGAECDNAWSGSSVEEIEQYVMELHRADLKGVNTSLYVIVDEEGLRDNTCVFGEHILDDTEWDTEHKLKDTGEFNKVRMPWDEMYLSWCNLDIANMGFEEYCEGLLDGDADEEELRLTGKWWKYRSISDGPDLSPEKIIERDGELSKLESEGKA